jgi:hypothetical protein
VFDFPLSSSFCSSVSTDSTISFVSWASSTGFFSSEAFCFSSFFIIFGPLSSEEGLRPVASLDPSIHASETALVNKEIDLIASSFPGII